MATNEGTIATVARIDFVNQGSAMSFPLSWLGDPGDRARRTTIIGARWLAPISPGLGPPGQGAPGPRVAVSGILRAGMCDRRPLPPSSPGERVGDLPYHGKIEEMG
jgi:hypothetical protein